MDHQAQHVAFVVRECIERGITRVEADAQAEADWVQRSSACPRFNADFLEACTPGYYNNEGKPNPLSAQNAAYGKGPNRYFELMKAWREAGTFAGLVTG